MLGFPKTIKTGQDLFNCLAMVQGGELPAEKLRQEVERIERVNSLYVPIIESSGNTATVVYCSEAEAGMTLQGGLVITATETVNNAEGQPEKTVITFSNALPEGTKELVIPLKTSVYGEMNITPEQLQKIKEALEKL